jgi:adenine-specific DNA-methyltransferase
VNFLKANPALVVDTELFDPIFVERLLDQMDALDESINGVLIHSDNFQALRFLKEKYTDKLDAIYVDPPYNTDATPIVYKNGYRKSSWASFIGDRLEAGHRLLGDSGNLCITIDDYQLHELKFILSEVFGDDRVAGTVVIRSNPSGRPVPAGFAQSHEYAIFAGKTGFSQIGKLTRTEKQSQRYKENDQDGPYMWELFRKRGSNSERINRRTLYYPIYATESSLRVPEMHWDEANRSWVADEGPKSNEVSIYPIDDNKVERTWRGKWENVRNNPENYIVKRGQGGELTIYYKFRPADDGVLPTTTWIDSKYSATEHGTGVLRKMFTEYHLFDFPKSVYAVIDCIWVAGMSKKDSICMDFFGGSGTTAHAVIEMNRADAGERKFILVETESYFDTVLVPRIKKISYSAEWSGGRPISKGDGYSLFARCLRLETYEDALNNLNMRRSADQQSLLDLSAAQGVDNLKEQYLLSYMLDVETRGSQSLLNVQAFTDPTAYKLKVKRPGSDESREVNVDLLETFNWLVGLTVQHIAAPQVFAAESERDKEDRLQLKGRLKQDVDGPYWFRTVTGTTPDGRKTLIIWRKLTGNAEQDNLVLDEWFRRQAYSSKDAEFDLIYVNGDNNLENLKAADETWKVRLIEEDFHRLMFDTEGA